MSGPIVQAVLEAEWPRPSVMLTAVMLAWRAHDNGTLRVMQSWLASQMGTSRETVSRSVGALVEAEIIRISARGRGSYAWNPAALADLQAFIANIPDYSSRAIPSRERGERPANATGNQAAHYDRERPASARPVPARAEPYTLNARQLATLAAMRAERAALEARHGEENVYGGEQGLELVAPHSADDDCIALDPMPAAVD